MGGLERVELSDAQLDAVVGGTHDSDNYGWGAYGYSNEFGTFGPALNNIAG